MTDDEKRPEKPPREQTTEETMRKLFPDEAVEAAKREAEKAKERAERIGKKQP